jgi:hypothetical protein
VLQVQKYQWEMTGCDAQILALFRPFLTGTAQVWLTTT